MPRPSFKIQARDVAIQKSEPKTIRAQEAGIACDLEIQEPVFYSTLFTRNYFLKNWNLLVLIDINHTCVLLFRLFE